jgi:membrane associated rhomboid family serine protease
MLKRFTPILTLVGLCWLVFVANQLLWAGQLNRHGIIPRRAGSLPGILWAPVLHASFRHLAANTLPLLVLGGILCARSKGEFAAVTIAGTLLSGGLTWLFARDACHIGASGLIFCFFGYLASLACFRRTFGTLVLSVLCIVGYGGMLRGLVPTDPAVSWEGHLAGLVAGITLAWAGAKLNPPRKALETKPGTAGALKG